MSERKYSADEMMEAFLSWRDVRDPCERCSGAGVRSYASTATWRGGIGGRAITTGVCDVCWGSGDKFRKGADIRKLEAAARTQKGGGNG